MVAVAVIWFLVFNLNLGATSITKSGLWASESAHYVIHGLFMIVSLVLGMTFTECVHNNWVYLPGRV